MARFRGTLQGNRGGASRLGSKSSGLHVTANGWEIGATVELFVNGEGQDEISIWLTSGSNARHSSKLLYNGVKGPEE
jgi:hypothetical protein